MNKDFRSKFPSLKRKFSNKEVVYLDGPAGTQIPIQVIDRISNYYKKSNANVHGHFISSIETDKVIDETRKKAAIFLGASSPSCISFGQNMTTLTFSLSHAISKNLQAGKDEILITELDHESNRGPWLNLKTQGFTVREVAVKSDGTLNYEDFKKKINPNTKLVAMGMASNIFGTINNFEAIRKWTCDLDCLLLLDAVHYAPHFRINVSELDCDLLLCSAYKFYGPHVGILYAKEGLLNTLETDRLRTQSQDSPYRIETGTLNHAALAGVSSAIDFIAELGEGKSLTYRLNHAFQQISTYEGKLATYFYQQLNSIPALDVFGPSFQDSSRAPTLAVIHKNKYPNEVCQHLAKYGIFAWAGHFYAIKATEALGLDKIGGVTRMGISAYTSKEEIDFTLNVLEKF